MNLEKLFKIQKELDERILNRFPDLRNEDLLPKKILALQVELGELAQNWRGFKFWSEDQSPRNRDIPCHACKGKAVFFEDGSNQPCLYCSGSGVQEKNPLLEEFVDVFHFLLSIGLEIGSDVAFEEYTLNEIWEEGTKYTDERYTLTEVFYLLIDDVMWKMESCGYWLDFVMEFTDLGKRLGLTMEQVIDAYLDKNKTNHTRQEQNY